MNDVGYILHRRAYRETSVIIDCLTHEHGRMAFVVKGARGPRSRQCLQAFTPIALNWRGQAQMPTAYQLEATGPTLILQDLALISAMYCNELLYHLLTAGEPCSDTFVSYHRLLTRLATDDSVEPALRCFEFELLAELGYGLGLTQAQFEPTAYYRYDSETGLLPCAEQTAYRGDVLNAIANSDYQERVTRQVAKRLARQALQPLLGNKVLRTKELFYGKADLPRG